MLTDQDKDWLSTRHPGLAYQDGRITGIIYFDAIYDATRDLFFNLEERAADIPDGLRLAGRYQIRIEPRVDAIVSKLPALYVEGVEPIADRHFGQSDKSACLCSPFAEDEFLFPTFEFRRFLEQLVVPFLYGQEFYSRSQRWPWAELAHGTIGLLEAYAGTSNSAKADECLRRLELDPKRWPYIKAALRQKPYVKGHTPCFCGRGDQIRRCHPSALKGVLKLQKDIYRGSDLNH